MFTLNHSYGSIFKLFLHEGDAHLTDNIYDIAESESLQS